MRGLMRRFALLFFLLTSLVTPALAAELETRFGPIEYDRPEQLPAYAKALEPYLRPAVNFRTPEMDEILARHEYIFESVGKKLGIKVDKLKTRVRLVDTLGELRAEYRRLVPESDKKVTGFYVHATHTIWYALERLDFDLAHHETAHAVLGAYFLRPIPAEIDEMVARGVERRP